MTNIVPLHLQLVEIDLGKRFKKQKVVFKKRVPVLPYFQETMNRLGLRVIEKSVPEDVNKEKVIDNPQTE